MPTDTRVRISVLEQELDQARTALTRQQALARQQAEVFARTLASQDGRVMAVRRTIAFQLGDALLNGFRSGRSLRALPGKLKAIHLENLRRKAMGSDPLVLEADPATVSPFLTAWSDGGMAAVHGALERAGLSPERAAAILAGLHRALMRQDIGSAAQAARAATAAIPSRAAKRWLVFRLLDCGQPSEAIALADSLEDGVAFTPVEVTRLEAARGTLRLHQQKPDLTRISSARDVAPDPRCVLYVAASARPYHQSGYTLRTEAVVRAMQQAGISVELMTRPGYPWDRSDALATPEGDATTLDGQTCAHARFPLVSSPIDIYVELAALEIMDRVRAIGAGTIHAASNHVNALPALVAARRLGLRFHYEMRGIWELSRAPKVPGFEQCEAFDLALELEGFVARQADKVLAISPQLADFAHARWGLSPDTVAIMPNGVDPATIPPARTPPNGPFTIAYAGALISYEGLDLLIEAVQQLKAGRTVVQVEIIGDGDCRPALEDQVRKVGLAGQVRFLGRLPQSAARTRLQAAHLVCLPRRQDRVCEIVPPLKLVEAMALGVPVLAADLPVLRGELADGETGFFFRSGDAAALAERIRFCITSPDLMASVRTAARRHAMEARSWANIIEPAVPLLHGIDRLKA